MLTGVLLEVSREGVVLVATDSYRLAIRDLVGSADAEAKAIVPERALSEAGRAASGDDKGEVEVFVDESQASFRVGQLMLTSRLIEGEFPNYRQLLPDASFGLTQTDSKEGFAIPCVRIEDYPRFEWRGMHLDVSRRFFDIQFVKRYLDHLAMHKINVFHWHLTDDDGWRVEIKKYPKLTRVGAWRGPKEALPPSYESGNERYGGFYTQDEVRRIVAHAAARNVTIVPEIDMPGHATAAIVAYPQLGVTSQPPQAVPADWGIYPNLFNVEESTFEFLQDVLAEVMELFPGEYIHVGGDEGVDGGHPRNGFTTRTVPYMRSCWKSSDRSSRRP